MAPNSGYSWTQYADDQPVLTVQDFLDRKIQEVTGGPNAELGYPTPSAPVQGVTSTDIPAQTGMRPDPRIVGREEMVAENIRRALGRNRMMMAPVVPGSLNQEQFMKELKEIQALTTPAPAPTAAEDTGSISDILGAPQRVYDPEQGRFVPKWDLSKIDPRYGLQSYEAIQSYLERMENQPQVAPQQVAAAAARQAPVSPVAARPSSPTPDAATETPRSTSTVRRSVGRVAGDQIPLGTEAKLNGQTVYRGEGRWLKPSEFRQLEEDRFMRALGGGIQKVVKNAWETQPLNVLFKGLTK